MSLRHRPILLSRDAPTADKEFGEVRVSLGVISGRVVLNRSTWQQLRRAFRRKTLDELVEIPSAEAFLHVQASDYGVLDLHFRIVNFSKVELRVEHLEIDWLGFTGNELPGVAPQRLYRVQPIAPQAVGQATCRMLLGPAAIRELMTRVRPPGNPRSSPDAHIHLRGTFTVSQKSNRANLEFDLNLPTPHLNFNYLPPE
jgi:hypothetical protein